MSYLPRGVRRTPPWPTGWGGGGPAGAPDSDHVLRGPYPPRHSDPSVAGVRQGKPDQRNDQATRATCPWRDHRLQDAAPLLPAGHRKEVVPTLDPGPGLAPRGCLRRRGPGWRRAAEAGPTRAQNPEHQRPRDEGETPPRRRESAWPQESCRCRANLAKWSLRSRTEPLASPGASGPVRKLPAQNGETYAAAPFPVIGTNLPRLSRTSTSGCHESPDSRHVYVAGATFLRLRTMATGRPPRTRQRLAWLVARAPVAARRPLLPADPTASPVRRPSPARRRRARTLGRAVDRAQGRG